jgi:hypothetical protein
LALKFAEGKLCDSQFGDPQYMFTTTDDRVFFVAEKVAQKIHGLRLQPREPLEITKAEVDYGNGRKGIEWQVAKGFVPGEQPDGTFAVPTVNQPGAGAGTPTPAATAPIKTPPTHNNGNGSKSGMNGNGSSGHRVEDPSFHVGWATFLLAQTNALVDVYAASLQYASQKYGNQVKPEDVRALLTTAFINVSKQGGVHVA